MRHAASGAVLFVLSAWALGTGVAAAAPDPGPQDKRDIRHDVAVTLKLVQVFVLDKKGNPVLDLTKDDFRVFDNGRRRTVTEFERHVLRPPAAREGEEPAGLETSSLPSPPSLMPRKFFLFFDFAYNTPKGLLKAREAALHFIDSGLLPTDELGVLSYSGLQDLELWEYLTTDHAKVREAVEAFGLKKLSGRVENLQEKYYEAVTGQNPADASARGRPTLRGAENRLPDMGAKPDLDRTPELTALKFAERGEIHALMFADRIKDLALALRYVPGQKNIILLSSGVPYSLIYGVQAPYGDIRFGSFGNSLLRERYEDMLRELTASNCIIYALDTEDAGAGLRKETRTMGVFSLQKMTAATGGRYFGNINGYEGHLERIQDLTGGYYVLGYSVDEKWDGAYHRIRVEVGRPGCEVLAQRGYYNPKPFKGFSEVERLLQLVDLALNEKPHFETPVRFPVARETCPPDGKSDVCLTAELPLDEIGEILQGRCEIVGIVFDEKGNTVELKRRELKAGGRPEEKRTHAFDFAVPPGAYECRIILRNLETGKAAVGGVAVTVEGREQSR